MTGAPCRLKSVFKVKVVALGLVLLSLAAHAHDLYEIWTIGILRSDQLEVGITMAKGTALRLIDPQAKIASLTPENFATHQATFEQTASILLTLTARGKTLAARKVAVELTDENDVVFHVAYPRPPPGVVHITAAFLRKLGDGYGGLLDVSDAAGNNLGWEQLMWAQPDFEVTIPPAKPAPESAAPSKTN